MSLLPHESQATFWAPVRRARSWLLVSGDRTRRLTEATRAGADVLVIDLAGSVHSALRANARTNVDHWLAGGRSGVVRINPPGTQEYHDDVAMLATHSVCVMVPDIASADELAELVDELPVGSVVVPVLGSATAILDVHEIATVPGCIRAVFDEAALIRQLGLSTDDGQALSYARSQVVLASASAGIAPPVDGPSHRAVDDHQFGTDVEHVAELGFTGKVCLSRRQLACVHQAFTPSDDKIQWARQVVRASSDGSATTLGQDLVGTPVITRARRLLELWDQ